MDKKVFFRNVFAEMNDKNCAEYFSEVSFEKNYPKMKFYFTREILKTWFIS